jgi:hypothetical protein
MTKGVKPTKKEREYTIHVTVLSCDVDKEEMEQREKRLAELLITAALRKWKRERSFPAAQNSSRDA